MKALIDTNVVLDFILHRQPWYTNAVLIFGLAQRNIINGYIPASAITDIFYIARKQLDKNTTQEAMKRLLQVFKPATVTENHIYQALDLDWDDFEDSVQFIVGESIAANYIVTRDTQDFSSASITAVTPEQFLETITDMEK